MVKLGDKFTLWRHEYSREAYTDQMGRKNTGYLVTEQFQVTVTEIRNNVRDMWTDELHHTGWKAVTEQGRTFTCNWNVFPSDAMTPTYHWDATFDEETNKYFQPIDAVQAYNYPGTPHVIDNQRAIPLGAVICSVHDLRVLSTQ